jgi:uncharacterized surface anchored protein
MIRTHGRNLITHALTALVLALGIALTTAAPALAAIDTTRQTTSDEDGVLSMTAERMPTDRYPDLIKVTYTVDTNGITPTEDGYLHIDLKFDGMCNDSYDDDSSLNPTISVDDGPTTPIDFEHVPDLGMYGVGGGMEVSTYNDGTDDAGVGHKLEITCYGEGINFALGSGSGVSTIGAARRPITLTVRTNNQGGHYDHEYQCSIDRVFPTHFEVNWDDAKDIAGLRPSATEYANAVRLYVGDEPYTGTGSQLVAEASTWQQYYLVGPNQDVFPTLLVPTGTQLTYVQSSVPHYTSSTTTLDAMYRNPDNPMRLATITNSLATQNVTEGSLTVTLKDSSAGDALPGGTYELRDAAGSVVATFTTGSNGTFTIDPADADLAAALPAADEASDLTLVETAAPSGYQLDASAHRVLVSRTDTISAAAGDDTSTYVRTSSYAFEVDGTETEAVSFTNVKTPAPEQAKPASNPKPAPAKATVVPKTSVPKTGDPTPLAIVGVLVALGCVALVVARKVARTGRR